MVDTINKKYRNHNPLYRQSVGIKRDANVGISQSTLSSCTLKAGKLLLSVVAAMKAELLAGAYIQADETTVPVQSERTKGKNHQGYLWEYSRPGELVVYDFQMGRGREGPAGFLEGFEGRLQSDGYAAYCEIGGPGLLHFGCWAHVRRKFFEASESSVPGTRGAWPWWSRLESFTRWNGSLERQSSRRSGAGGAASEGVSGAFGCGKGAGGGGSGRGLAQEWTGQGVQLRAQAVGRLECYAGPGHGMVEIDNNWAENAKRPIALGRKNWIQIGSEKSRPEDRGDPVGLGDMQTAWGARAGPPVGRVAAAFLSGDAARVEGFDAD